MLFGASNSGPALAFSGPSYGFCCVVLYYRLTRDRLIFLEDFLLKLSFEPFFLFEAEREINPSS
jgi:hypothetical protein